MREGEGFLFIYHNAIDEAFEDVLHDGDGGELDLAEVADEGDGDDADGELGHRGEDRRRGDLPHFLGFVQGSGFEGLEVSGGGGGAGGFNVEGFGRHRYGWEEEVEFLVYLIVFHNQEVEI